MASEAELAERLANWARWLRTSPPRLHAYSAEGMYRAPDWESDLEQRPPAPRAFDAWDIEIAVRILPLPHHTLLRLRYVEHRSDAAVFAVMRKQLGVRLNTNGLIAMEASAVVQLRDALRLPPEVRQARAQARTRKALQPISLDKCLTALFGGLHNSGSNSLLPGMAWSR